jgi:hypothetical protein
MVEAAESHHLRRTLGEKDARIAELESQLQRTRSAAKTTPKAGSLIKGDGAAPKADEPADPTDWKARMRARRNSVGGDE